MFSSVNKKDVRKAMLAKRQTMSNASELSNQIAKHVLAQEVWLKAKAVALYLDINNEVQTDFLIKTAWEQGKQVFLPRCIAGDELIFMAYTDKTSMVLSKYNILEPDPQGFRLTEPNLDIVFMPALALTPQGGRLGYGKGYYDRTFSKVGWQQILRLGLVYSWQITDFPITPLDLACQGYATETGVHWL